MWSKALIGLIIGRIATTLIGSTMSVSIGWHLYESTGEAFDLALVGIFQIVPVISLFLVAGWAADNFSRKSILLLSASLQLFVVLAVAILMNQPELNKWALFLSLSVLGAGRAFFAPAIQSVLPNIVSTDHLGRAVAAISSMWNIALTVGPFLAGVLLAMLDRQLYWVLIIFGLFTLGGFSLLPALKIHSERKLDLKDIFSGVHYLMHNNVVRGALFTDLVVILCGSVMAILPVFVKDVLHEGPETLGLLRAMPAVGATLIGLTMVRRKRAIERNGPLLFWSLIIFSFSIIGFAFSQNLYVACFALLIYGGSDMISVVIRSSVVQIMTPDALRGRVSAVNSLFIASSNELGDFRSGSVTAAIGPVACAVTGGVMSLGVVLLFRKTFRPLFELQKIEPPELSKPE